MNKHDHIRGLTAEILRGTYRSKRNVLHQFTEVTLVGNHQGEAIAPVIEPSHQRPAIILGETVPGHTVAWPIGKGDHWLMFGGTFVYSGDERWPRRAPIPLHDRYEGEMPSFRALELAKPQLSRAEAMRVYRKITEGIGQAAWAMPVRSWFERDWPAGPVLCDHYETWHTAARWALVWKAGPCGWPEHAERMWAEEIGTPDISVSPINGFAVGLYLA